MPMISFRISDDECNDLNKKASEKHMTRTEYILACCKNNNPIKNQSPQILKHLINAANEMNSIRIRYPNWNYDNLEKEITGLWCILK